MKNHKTIIKVLMCLICISLFASIAGCELLNTPNKAVKKPPVYSPSVPEEVSFVVYPFNNYIEQIQFASQIESLLLKVGLNVVASNQDTKEIEERKGAGLTQDSGGSNLSSANVQREESQAVRIERYTITQETAADFIVETMLAGQRGTVKFTRKEDSKIIGVFSVSKYNPEKEFMKQLESMQLISKKR